MSQIRARNTKPELIIRKFLFSQGFRFRLHDKKLPGKPDLVFPKYKTVLFIHGCFWHGHTGCRYYVVPKTRTEWWLNKISGNARKDGENISLLKKSGWNVMTIWECELRLEKREHTLKKLLKEFRKL